MYEYDSRGYVTINIPFNGKIVGTIKYKENLNASNLPEDNLVETSFIQNNYLGTPAILTDINASTTNVISRNTWGEIVTNNLNSNNQTNTGFGFTGHKWDENSSLTYAHARYYDAMGKHWLSHDPFAYDNFTSDKFLLDPQNQNTYSYVKNNPVNNIDPDGKQYCAMDGCYDENGNKQVFILPIIEIPIGYAVLAVRAAVPAVYAARDTVESTLGQLGVRATTNLNKLATLPMVTTAAEKINGLSQRIETTPQNILNTASKVGNVLVDTKNGFNVNILIPQTTTLVTRVTTNPTITRIISVGTAEVSQITSGLQSSRFVPITNPTVVSNVVNTVKNVFTSVMSIFK